MAVIIIGIITLGILVAKQMGVQFLASLNSSTVLLAGMFAMLAYTLWRNQQDTDDFDLMDILRDERTGKASQSAVITFVMAGLAVWWIVTQTLAAKDVGERIVDVLMIFVIYRGASRAVDAWRDKPAAPTQPAGDIAQQVIVTPNNQPKPVPEPELPDPPSLPEVRSVPPPGRAGRTPASKTTRKG